MGKVDGFLELERRTPETEDPEKRVKHYKEFYKPHNEELSKEQAARCMDCGVPFCHSGCPLGNIIPDFNDAVYHNDWERATTILLETNNFPEFTGRICPAPCEGSCVLGINKDPVAIEFIEKAIIEKAFENNWIKPKLPESKKGKSVGIVGSGPAGLAAADQLSQAGYEVTVYERDPKPGGLLRFGIPDFKLEKWVVERRIDILEKQGVNFINNCNVGFDVDANDLNSKHDAILLTGGSTIPRDLPVPGRDLKGVHFAMEFLSQQNKRVSGIPVKEKEILATDKNVIVIGGGDTGSDCIGTSNRHGAKSIVQFELLGKPSTSRTEKNPWPEWPMTIRTSSSHEEGCERKWSIMTKEFMGDDSGNLTGLKTVNVDWSDGKLREIEGTEKIYPCELVLLAMGFIHPQKDGIIDQLGVELDERGNVAAENYQTNIPNVFSAGDMRRGQSLVVWAISEGREAARKIDQFLDESVLAAKKISSYQL